MKIRLSIIIILCCLSFKVQAQDPIFSQYFLVPETINPGFSGFEDASYFGLIHRTQWPSLDLRVDTEYAFFNSWIEHVGGIGFSILNQHESNTKYNHLQGNITFAYHVQLANEWFFRPAIEVGFGTKSFNFGNLVLSDQININSGTINSTSSDPFAINANRNISFVDFTAGFVFDKKNTSNDTDLWLGATVKHLNKPNISMQSDGQANLDMFMSLHGSFYIPTGVNRNDYELYILANAMQQGAYNRVDLGAKYQMDDFSFALLAASNPNKGDPNSHFLTSINAFVGLDWEGFRFGYSYDFNMTGIGTTGGVYELSIIYDLLFIIY